MVKVAINGFGRIGRNAFKIAFERSDLEIVGINDLTDTRTLAHLLKYDTSYGTYHKNVSHDENGLIVDGKHIRVTALKEPRELPWRDLGVDVVIESTGRFVDPAAARGHIEAGAKKVVISAPAKGEGAKTIVLGVNENVLDASDEIVSCASCTTNCIAPVMKVLEETFGIDKAMMTTVHSYTATQVLQDGPSKDLRESRAAAENIVPTTTGASIAAGLTLPAIAGKFIGLSVRVPVPVVSMSDFAILLKRDANVDEINEAFRKAASEPYYQGILSTTEEPLVSSDFRGNSHSAIVDLKLTDVVGGNLIKVVAWYDNEWGYSNRLVELTADFGKVRQMEIQPEEQKEEPKIEQSQVEESKIEQSQVEEQPEEQSDERPEWAKAEQPQPEEHREEQPEEEPKIEDDGSQQDEQPEEETKAEDQPQEHEHGQEHHPEGHHEHRPEHHQEHHQ